MLTMLTQALIFDLDGTLLDTLDDIANSANSVLSRYGFPTHAVDAYRWFVGDGVTMLMARALPAERRTDDNITSCAKAFREVYRRNWNVHTRPYNGIPELLNALSARDVEMAVLSNKPHDFTKLCVQEFLGEWPFEMVLGLRHGVPQKPDPAGALKIAARLARAPARILYLGDSAVDMKTAVNAGMFPLGALWGFRALEELLENGAGGIVETPMDVLGYLDKPQPSGTA
jgi:phosphoglycolate phosphatase